MSRDTISYSDKMLMLRAIEYLMDDVSNSDRWDFDVPSKAKTLFQLRYTRQLIETEASKVTQVFHNNVLVAIETFRSVATPAQKRQLTKIRRVWLSSPMSDLYRQAIQVPTGGQPPFVLLVDEHLFQ